VSKQSIRIERLEIRFKGVSPLSARAAIDGLGRELLGQLSGTQLPSGAKSTVRIDQLDAGRYPVASGTGPAELRGKIAERVAASIRSSHRQD